MYNTLRILDAGASRPVITSSVPASFSANISEDLTIFLTVTGNPPIRFEVYRIEDSNLPLELLTENHTRFAYSLNGTHFQLTINDLHKSDAGNYSVVAINQIGNFEITVTVQPVGKLQFLVRALVHAITHIAE